MYGIIIGVQRNQIMYHCQLLPNDASAFRFEIKTKNSPYIYLEYFTTKSK
ncbi:hypothetical protein M2450_002805 [Dysgonomonas sp. PF1-23]|nr:hypothetical protein [Dysgonomonas sp. PF1-23]